MRAWWHKVFSALRSPKPVANAHSTRPELVEEIRKRRDEHDRTDRLARILNDYRRQDGVIRG